MAGANITPAVTVKILDENDNLIESATDEVTIAIENNPGEGTLSGTTTKAAVDGIATFNDLSIDKAGEGYKLKASSGSLTATISIGTKKGSTQDGIISFEDVSKDTTIKGSTPNSSSSTLTAAISDAFNITPGTASKLVLTTYPSEVEAGSWSAKYTVQRQDEHGNPVTEGETTVNLSSSSDGAEKKFSETSGGDSEVTSVTIPDGSSSKDFYYYDEKAGECTISVSAEGLEGDSQSLTVNAGEGASISKVSGDCQRGEVNTALANPFVIKVTDDQGNGISGVTVTWSITETPADATGQELSATSTTTDSDGEAESTLTLGDKAGLYKVEASSSGLSGSPIKFTATNGKSYFIKGGRFYAFSIPYRLIKGNAEVILAELGPYDPGIWRLFHYAGEYHEYPNTPDFSPGLGYWLINAEDKEIFVEGGEDVNSDITLTLEPGWNQIGCPFACSVSWDSIKNENSNLFDNNVVADVLWGYDIEVGEYVMCDEMDPWQGYWVYNSSESNINLIIPYQ